MGVAALLVSLLFLAGSCLASEEATGCPRGCTCSRVGITQLVAVCSSFNGSQRFDESTGKLVIENAGGLVLSDNIFRTVGLGDVQFVSITSSVFQRIDAMAFAGLESLSNVQLEGNNRMVLTSDMFTGTSLVRLSIRQSKLRFSDGQRFLLDAPGISELELVNCDVAALLNPQSFSKMPLLQYINLASNMIRKLEPMFSGLEDLEQIDLSDNLISEIPPDMFADSNLDYLILQKNPISTIKGVKIPKLTDINLSLCKFSVIDQDMFSGVPQLTRLNLSANAITEIHPKAFFNLDSLVQIDLSNNALKGPLSGEIFLGNPALQVVSLAHNPGLRSLPEDMFNEKDYIFKLDLSFCGLTSLQRGIFKGLIALSTLNLAGNNLREIEPETLRASITNLDVSHNNITDVNLINFPSNAKVQLLNLADNNLGEVSTNTFRNLDYLRSLDLHSCGLPAMWAESSSERSSVLRTLIRLDVSKNNIQKILPRQLQLTPHLKMLDVSENRLLCDSNFHASLKWLQDHRVQHISVFEADRKDVMVGHPYGEDGLDRPNPLDTSMKGADNFRPGGRVDPRSWNLIEAVVCENKLLDELQQIQDEDPADDYKDDDDAYNGDPEDGEDEEDEDYMEPKIVEARSLDLWPIAIVAISGVAILMSLSVMSCFVLRWYRNKHSYGAAMIKHLNTPRLKRDRSSIYQQLHEDLNSPTTPVMSIKLGGKSEYSQIAPQSV